MRLRFEVAQFVRLGCWYAGVLLVVGLLVSCGKQAVKQMPILQSGKVVTSEALQIQSGAGQMIKAEVLENSLTKVDEIPVVLDEIKVRDGTFQPETLVLGYGDGKRVSAVTVSADTRYLGIGISISYEAQLEPMEVMQNVTAEELLHMACLTYGFLMSGTSAIATEDTMFEVSQETTYSAVWLYPQVYRLTGIWTDENSTQEVELLFPCVNNLGFLDGIYTIVQADDAEQLDGE